MNDTTDLTTSDSAISLPLATKTTSIGPATEILECPDVYGVCATLYKFRFCLDVINGVPRQSLRVPEDEDVRERDKLIEIVYPKFKEHGGAKVYTSSVEVALSLDALVSWRSDRAHAYTPLTAADFALEIRGLTIDGVAEPDPAVPSISAVDLTVLDGNQLGTPMCIVTFSAVAKALKKVEIDGATIKKGVSFVVDPVVIIAPKRP